MMEWKARYQIRSLTVCLLATFGAIDTLADAPPPLSADWEQWSANHQYVAHGDFSADRIFVEHVTATGRDRLWSISPWLDLHHTVLVANDGLSLVVAPWASKGGGLQQVVLTFYDGGGKGREWRLSDFFADTSLLPGSVSHWNWYKVMSWSDGRLNATTVDGRRLLFDRKGDPAR